MNKKGADLTLNTIIIGILVVLVLVVLVAFFLGGTAGLTKTIKSIFFGTTTGTDRTIAIETCRQRCDQLDSLLTDKKPDEIAATVDSSAFCKVPFEIDMNGDGKVDTYTKDTKELNVKYYCNGPVDTTNGVGSLAVSCKSYSCTGSGR